MSDENNLGINEIIAAELLQHDKFRKLSFDINKKGAKEFVPLRFVPKSISLKLFIFRFEGKVSKDFFSKYMHFLTPSQTFWEGVCAVMLK